MSANNQRDYEAERLERERRWQEANEAGEINTVSPHSDYIDPRTVPGMMSGIATISPTAHSYLVEMIRRESSDK